MVLLTLFSSLFLVLAPKLFRAIILLSLIIFHISVYYVMGIASFLYTNALILTYLLFINFLDFRKHNLDELKYPLTIFYDGACGLCSGKMLKYKNLDKFSRLSFIDISSSNFNAESYNLDPQLVQEYIHVRDASGEIVRGVDGFIWIWQAIGFKLPAFLKIPFIKLIAKIIYKFVSKLRYTLSKKVSEKNCGGRCLIK